MSHLLKPDMRPRTVEEETRDTVSELKEKRRQDAPDDAARRRKQRGKALPPPSQGAGEAEAATPGSGKAGEASAEPRRIDDQSGDATTRARGGATHRHRAIACAGHHKSSSSSSTHKPEDADQVGGSHADNTETPDKKSRGSTRLGANPSDSSRAHSASPLDEDSDASTCSGATDTDPDSQDEDDFISIKVNSEDTVTLEHLLNHKPGSPKDCDACKRAKRRRRRRISKLGSRQPKVFGEIVSSDHVNMRDEYGEDGVRGYKYMYNILDLATGFKMTIPSKTLEKMKQS